MAISAKTREFEQKLACLFSVQKPFSEHLLKWEDSALPDKYDHNCFNTLPSRRRRSLRVRWITKKALAPPFSSWKEISRWKMRSDWSPASR